MSFFVIYKATLSLSLSLQHIVNVHTKSFLDAAQHEKQMEREALSAGKMYDQLIEMTQVY